MLQYILAKIGCFRVLQSAVFVTVSVAAFYRITEVVYSQKEASGTGEHSSLKP